MITQINDKAFKNGLKLYKNNPITDQNVFNLIKKYVNKTLDEVTDLDDDITIIDENMLSQNEKDISFKLAKIRYNKAYRSMYKNLIEKFKEFKILIQDYEKLSNKHDNHLKTEKFKELDLLVYKLTFALIELKANLNISLKDIAMNDILIYCAMIENDITTNNYEALSFNQYTNDIQLKLR